MSPSDELRTLNRGTDGCRICESLFWERNRSQVVGVRSQEKQNQPIGFVTSITRTPAAALSSRWASWRTIIGTYRVAKSKGTSRLNYIGVSSISKMNYGLTSQSARSRVRPEQHCEGKGRYSTRLCSTSCTKARGSLLELENTKLSIAHDLEYHSNNRHVESLESERRTGSNSERRSIVFQVSTHSQVSNPTCSSKGNKSTHGFLRPRSAFPDTET